MTQKAVNCPSCGAQLNVLLSKENHQENQEAKLSRTAETVRKALPSDVVDDVTIAEKESTFHIVPKRFLGSEKFSKIMQVVRNLHGEYVSRGKTSYWWVPKREKVGF